MSTFDINQDILNYIDGEWINNEDDPLDMELQDFYDFNGIKVPRVTHVIKACNLNTNNLLIWANRLGYKHISYEKYMNKAATMGTAIHNAIEGYIKDGSAPIISELAQPDVRNAILNAYEGFKAFWDKYKSTHNIADIKLEYKLSNQYFGGTADFIITEKNGCTTLYDFKSSNHLRASHFIQLAAYKYALECFHNPPMKINKIGILLLNKKTPLCQEYILDMNMDENRLYIDNCTRCFISMLYTYYNDCVVENSFSDVLFPGRMG